MAFQLVPVSLRTLVKLPACFSDLEDSYKWPATPMTLQVCGCDDIAFNFIAILDLCIPDLLDLQDPHSRSDCLLDEIAAPTRFDLVNTALSPVKPMRPPEIL